jgi:hypothetical protein
MSKRSEEDSIHTDTLLQEDEEPQEPVKDNSKKEEKSLNDKKKVLIKDSSIKLEKKGSINRS